MQENYAARRPSDRGPRRASSDSLFRDDKRDDRADGSNNYVLSADIATWAHFQGKRELIAYLEGKDVHKSPSIKAMCYGCMGGYPNGAMDCLLVRCPLYPFMPYRGKQVTVNQERALSKSKRKTAQRARKGAKVMSKTRGGTIRPVM